MHTLIIVLLIIDCIALVTVVLLHSGIAQDRKSVV